MSKAEIMAEISKLKPADRAQVFERLCELQEEDLLQGGGPTEREKQLLDRALADFEHDRDPGVPWRDALRQIRSAGPR